MKGYDILVTGGAGSIGSELVRQCSMENRVFIIDNNETALFDLIEELAQSGRDVQGYVGDIRKVDVFDRMVHKWGYPFVVFHCAALKHVTPSAWSPEEYASTNIGGTLNVLNFARNSMKVVNISTDKVVHANSIMGATKRVAELAVRDAKQISVRFGNVMGSRGSVIPIWQRQIDKGNPLTVTDSKMERYMMTIPEACSLVIEAAETAEPGSIMVMDMGETVNILKLAQDILGKLNKEVRIKMIGARPGETFNEVLMTEEEKSRAIKQGKFWIIK